MKAWGIDRDDIARLAHGADAAGQRLMAAGGHHQVGRAQAAAGVQHQAGDLFTQGEVAMDVVVVQAWHVLAPA
ncbi:hypothetical protein D3C81_1401550 [compost metagenome]